MPPTIHLAFFTRCLIDPALHASTASLAARLAHHGRERLASSCSASPPARSASRSASSAPSRSATFCMHSRMASWTSPAPTSSSAASSQAAAPTGPSAFLPHAGQQLPAFGGGTWTFTPASSPPAEASACAGVDPAGSQTSPPAQPEVARAEASTASQGHAPPARAARR